MLAILRVDRYRRSGQKSVTKETGRLVLKLALAAVIVGISAWIPPTSYREVFITLAIAGFLAGFVSGERLSILVAPLGVWTSAIANAWLYPNPNKDTWQNLLPWNILYTEFGAWDIVTVLIPTGFFAFLGWLCRAAIGWMHDTNRRPLSIVIPCDEVVQSG